MDCNVTLVVFKFCSFIDAFDVYFDEQKLGHLLAMFGDGLIRSFVTVSDHLNLNERRCGHVKTSKRIM